MNTRHKPGLILQYLPILCIFGIFGIGWVRGVPVPAAPSKSLHDSQDVTASSELPKSLRRLNWLALADPAQAQRLGITPQHQAEISRIDAELDRKSEQAVRVAIHRWQQRGGFHVEPLPNFRDPYSLYGSELKALKQAAEDRIANVLSIEEINRCRQEMRMRQGGPRLQMMQAALSIRAVDQ